MDPMDPWIDFSAQFSPGNCGFRQEIDSLEHARDLTAQKSVASVKFHQNFPAFFFSR